MRDHADSSLSCVTESRFGPSWQPLAVYHEEIMFGMVVVDARSNGTGVIEHLMIDARFQNWGMGRAALQAAVWCLRSSGAGRGVRPIYHPGNPAVKLYESVGLGNTGEKRGGGADLLTNPAKHGRRHDGRNPKALTVPP